MALRHQILLGGIGHDMTRHATIRRLYCERCRRVTVHDVTTYLDDPHRPDEVIYCTECGS